MTSQRLQKILSAAGYGSRRACEEFLRAGRVAVNGRPAQLGESADSETDEIRVDGRILPATPKTQTFALYKPRYVVSSLAAQGERSTVRDLLPFQGRFFPVGRLDLESEGLMLMTNDGALAQRISHPRFETEKEYRVLLAARPSAEQFAIWQRGVVLEDGFRTGKARVFMERTFGKGAWVRVIMHEGHKHEIREIGRRIGLPVVRIHRIRIGPVLLGQLKPGEWRALTDEELAGLRAGRNPAPRPTRKPFIKSQSGKPSGKPSAKPHAFDRKPSDSRRSSTPRRDDDSRRPKKDNSLFSENPRGSRATGSKPPSRYPAKESRLPGDNPRGSRSTRSKPPSRYPAKESRLPGDNPRRSRPTGSKPPSRRPAKGGRRPGGNSRKTRSTGSKPPSRRNGR